MSDAHRTPAAPASDSAGPAEPGWMPFREGIEIKRLFRHPVTGYEVAMLRYAPGAAAPAHRHVADEHVYVLAGSQRDERGLHRAGSYVYNAAGTSHSVLSDEGCVVLIHWLSPVEFL